MENDVLAPDGALPPADSRTTRVVVDGGTPRLYRCEFTLEVVEGPDADRSATIKRQVTSIGSSPQNDLVLSDPSVSRFHLRVELEPDGLCVSDLDSTNGTFVHGLKLGSATIDPTLSTALRLGQTVVRLTRSGSEHEIQLSKDDRFGPVLGRSPVMRELFAQLEAMAASEAAILLEGETGSGKDLIAEEIHRRSKRAGQPFVVIDCGAIAPTLLETELFGHVAGAFTGAESPRVGAFAEADGGTVFIDEIGELDLSLQPKLLRALEAGSIKPVGANQHQPIDVRVIAATNRDLQRDVNTGRFRADLYYRLAVLHLRVPPLRQRPGDVELLVKHMLAEIARERGTQATELAPETMQQLVGYAWPGNVRELRNFVERIVISTSAQRGEASLLQELKGTEHSLIEAPDELDELGFHEAKARWINQFELGYLTRLLEQCNHNIAEAARRSGIARGYLFRLIKRHGIR